MKKQIVVPMLSLQLAVGPAAHAFNFPFFGGSSSSSNSQSLAKTQSSLRRDESDAERIVLAEAIYRVNQKNDISLASNVLQSLGAKTADDATKRFNSLNNDRAEEWPPRDVSVSLIKAGVKYFGGPEGKTLAGGVDYFAQKVADFEKKAGGGGLLTSAAREQASIAMAGALSQMPTEARERVVREMAKEMGLDYEDALRQARNSRVLREGGEDSKANIPKDVVTERVLAEQLSTVKEQLKVEGEVLRRAEKKMQADEKLAAQRAELATQVEHERATAYLAATVLGPVIGARAAGKVNEAANHVIDIQQAIKKFGPGGLTPDKLLMFTNVVTAGIALAQMFGSQGQDPTMAALEGIRQQLEQIQAQLNRMEGKIDRLTDLVLEGFDKVLKGQQDIEDRIARLEEIVSNDIKDHAQVEAVKTFIKYARRKNVEYRTQLKCAGNDALSAQEARDCRNDFALDFASDRILTQSEGKTIPQILDPELSNQTLTWNFGDQSRIARTQFSTPRFFAREPEVFRSVIARNAEAVTAYGSRLLSFPKPAIPAANPEVLAIRARTLLDALRARPELRTRPMADVIDQAIQRIDDVRESLAQTRTPEILNRLWNRMSSTMYTFEQAVAAAGQEINTVPLNRFRDEFVKAGLKPCEGDLPDLEAPQDPSTHQSLEAFIPRDFLMARQLGLGEIRVCYEASLRPEGKIHAIIRPAHSITQHIRGYDGWDDVVTEIPDEGYDYLPANYLVHVRFFPNTAAIKTATSQKVKPQNVVMTQPFTEITMRTFVSVQHYTTQWNSTKEILTEAWTTGMGDERHSLDCTAGQNRANCHANIPRDVFVAKAWEVLPQEYRNAGQAGMKEIIDQLVSDSIRSASQVWNAEEMSVVSVPDPKLASGLGLHGLQPLAKALGDYTTDYLFAENLILQGYVHGNETQTCLSKLGSFSPESLVGAAAQKAVTGMPPYSAGFAKWMGAVTDACSRHEISPGLVKSRAELTQWRDKLRGENR